MGVAPGGGARDEGRTGSISRHKGARKVLRVWVLGEERERETVSRVLIHLKLVIQIPPPVLFLFSPYISSYLRIYPSHCLTRLWCYFPNCLRWLAWWKTWLCLIGVIASSLTRLMMLCVAAGEGRPFQCRLTIGQKCPCLGWFFHEWTWVYLADFLRCS